MQQNKQFDRIELKLKFNIFKSIGGRICWIKKSWCLITIVRTRM